MDDADPVVDTAQIVVAAAQQVADVHRQLTTSAAWRATGGRPTDPAAAEAALAQLRELRERSLDLLADAVRSLEDELGA